VRDPVLGIPPGYRVTDCSLANKRKGRSMTTVAAILKHKGYQVSTVDPTQRVAEVTLLLSERRIGAVLVIDNADQMLGIVSERDIVRSLAANGARTLEMTAGQLMTRAVQVARPETTVAEAMQMMTAGRFRHLPVVDHETLVGLISIGDVVKARIMEQDTAVDSLTAYVVGSV
jgi:CBS domain-containing protein